MIRVCYATTSNRPPHRVDCRVVGTVRPWPEYAGLYVDGQWVFELPDGSAEVVLVLDGQVEGTPFAPATTPEVDDVGAGLAGVTVPVAVDEGRLQRTWFARGADATTRWDVVIVGQGFGGGVLHTALARDPVPHGRRGDGRPDGLQVLGLDAGSLLFTGHAGNQPAVRVGDAAFPITMWNTLQDFGTYPFRNLDPTWKGKEVFALGGRSLYWGAVCPRVDPAELAHWPKAVRRDLPTYYQAAEDMLGVGHPRADGIARDGLRLLDALLPERDNTVAPVALHTEKATSWKIPGGLFSTAELLVEERLSRRTGDGGFGPPFVHLGEIAVRVEPDPGGWRVHTVDLRDGSATVRYARRVVLACGTVESARLVAASPDVVRGLPPRLAPGAGFTEHLMAWVHFEIPPGSPYCRADTSAKLLSTPGSGGEDWNLLLDLGSDLNFGRSDAQSWARSRTSAGSVAGQLVILGRADLELGGVTFGPDEWLPLNVAGGGLPSATVPPDTRPAVPGTWNAAAQRILGGLGARPLAGDHGDQGIAAWPGLTPGARGIVAHEVGTLRMATTGGAVDADLAVTGSQGLFVCDNSVFPTSPAANPSLTLAALALRLAEHLRGLPW
jgi:hypothetical protein